MQEIVLKNKKLDFRTQEAIKILRSNVEFSGIDVKTVFFTSIGPGEGKSTISFELAKSFADSGKKTLYLDLDLRKSKFKERYVEGRIRFGFSYYLTGKVYMDKVLCATNISNLYVVHSGPVPPNPSELLNGKMLEDFLNTARADYDMIIIDTPPIGSVIDAAIISKHCDGGILVFKAGHTSYRAARVGLEQLERSHCKVLGCVLNQAKVTSGSYYGKYYGKYYGNYENKQ